jgi:TraM recognition site of TraD and TraG
MGPARALLLVDEVGALGSAARHLRGLVGRAREAGLAVVLATQGPSDLEAVDRALLPQVLQDTAWQLAFRQGSPRDAERMQALFGKAWVNDESWSSDGRTMTRRVERPRVSIDEWMNALEARGRLAAGGADRPRLAPGACPGGAAVSVTEFGHDVGHHARLWGGKSSVELGGSFVNVV